MAVNDPNYRYATQTWEADGIRTEYEINFDGGFIRQSDVVAFSVLVDPATGLVSDRTTHTLTFLTDAGFLPEDPTHRPASVEITPAVADGRRVVIFRSTEKSFPMVDYQNGSILTKKNLDLANRQAVLAIAEIMDGLNAAAIDITDQVQQVVNLNETIEIIYQQVVDLLAAGGIVSVEPLYWNGAGDNPAAAEYPIPGASVQAAAFYDVYIGGNGAVPEQDYTIILGEDPADSVIRFTPELEPNVTWLVVLRGYAKPYTGAAPVTDLRIPILTATGTSYFIDIDSEFSLVRASNAAGCTFTVKEIPPSGDRLGTGSFFSVRQDAAGQCLIVPENGDVSISTPNGYLPRTRGLGSIVTAVCEGGDTNTWVLSGDLAIDPEVVATGGPVTSLTAISGDITVNCALANNFKSTLTANTDLLVSNVNPDGYVTDFELWIAQDATGGWTLTLPASFKPVGGSDTVISAAPNTTTIISAKTIDGGITWAYAMQELGT